MEKKREVKKVMMRVMLEVEVMVMNVVLYGESVDGDDGEENRRGGGEDGGFVMVVLIFRGE